MAAPYQTEGFDFGATRWAAYLVLTILAWLVIENLWSKRR